MAETAVLNLLANFSLFFQREVNLLSGVREEIKYIRDEFNRMMAFLRVADSMEENDPELKVWVKQVRDAAYYTEDVLDKFKLNFTHNHGTGFRGFVCKISFSIKTLKARYQIAYEVQGIKNRVINISMGHQRYHDRYGMLEQGSRSIGVNNAWYDCHGDALLREEAELVGIEKPKTKMIGWLVKGDPRLKVISVAIKKHFQIRAWITVSESIKIEELLKGRIHQVFKEVKQPVPQGVKTMDWNSLKGIMNAFLRQKRYVLVFDDVWNIQAWQAFRYTFPECNCGSRVMLTTRNADLALLSSIVYNGYVYDLHPLSPQESWTLFCKKTFQENYCPSHLEGLLTSILRRCKGLPLAIAAISEDHLIEHWRLIWLWIAEGFVEVKEGAPIEQVAEGHITELVNRSLSQVAKIKGKRIKFYHIRHHWREIIVAKPREQNIVTIATERGMRRPERVCRFSIHDHLGHLQQSKRFTRLRSLLLFRTTYSPSMPSMLASVRELKLMKVLDLSGASLKIFPNEVVKLGHLTYLSLKGTEVRGEDRRALCSSLQKLISLYALYVTATEEDEIIDLQSLSAPPQLLQTLFLKGRLEKLPHWTPSLHSLVTVCLRWSKVKDADSLQHLQGLPNLVYLDLVEAYERKELCFKAVGFQKLKILMLIR
ncbi:hypothetical protein ACSBR2_037378 [Camellia fascicularis]